MFPSCKSVELGKDFLSMSPSLYRKASPGLSVLVDDVVVDAVFAAAAAADSDGKLSSFFDDSTSFAHCCAKSKNESGDTSPFFCDD